MFNRTSVSLPLKNNHSGRKAENKPKKEFFYIKDDKTLKFSAAAAACNLAEADSVSGMKTAEGVWEVYNKYSK